MDFNREPAERHVQYPWRTKPNESGLLALTSSISAIARTAARPRGSSIPNKSPNRPCFFQNLVFRTDTLFIRTENKVGARSAQ